MLRGWDFSAKSTESQRISQENTEWSDHVGTLLFGRGSQPSPKRGRAMAKEEQGVVQRNMQTLFQVGTLGGFTDGKLLEWYQTRSGEAAELAFAALVERHGPMVLRVCRAILGHEHDAHDA